MYAGITGALLVLSGVWHLSECLMSERNKDTRRLIPVGIVYLVLGALIVTLTGGQLVVGAALLLALLRMLAALRLRRTSAVRGWVSLVLIVLDVGIVLSALAAFVM